MLYFIMQEKYAGHCEEPQATRQSRLHTQTQFWFVEKTGFEDVRNRNQIWFGM